ncbi:hypothetical protein ElyMa_001587400 [Elysia marginata]|uniref:HORMA domain-containing protein n=1 Tax=Elysia marginata TaxID=1093978 RepID=A0AAV4JE68_9GAST|nr:hypothetical protein ElyMa_001587400 [Elysia marginata]
MAIPVRISGLALLTADDAGVNTVELISVVLLVCGEVSPTPLNRCLYRGLRLIQSLCARRDTPDAKLRELVYFDNKGQPYGAELFSFRMFIQSHKDNTLTHCTDMTSPRTCSQTSRPITLPQDRHSVGQF